ncbi:glycosyltransferase family 4 protein [Methanoculleus receptaculi]|uniref:Glycosyltransferase family 4 protein n=1 Tax=Methanoculleus receptaculi TaxID=394967 RepID=A0AAX4FYB8_9EURY|nr:glycosyltransferase family 4 protein [Methanoculleus receptaculi]WOX58351.1 glycosyltransferase family 4 protein [Methanoculleus receptaculi]
MGLRICILSVDFLPNVGGIAAHIYELARALRSLGNDVTIVTFRDAFFAPKEETVDGLHIVRVYLPKNTVLLYPVFALFEYFTVKRIVREKKIDLLHSHYVFPDGFVSRLQSGVPGVATEHTSGFLDRLERGRMLWLYRWVYARMDQIIAPSDELAGAVGSLGVPRQKITFVSNGVDTDKFSPEVPPRDLRKQYTLAPETRIVLCPRRLEPKNGVKYLVEAVPAVLRECPDTRFFIVGGSYPDQLVLLQKRARELGVQNHIIFAGSVPNAEMPSWYTAADVVVLPSLKEATSIAGLEAMACGKPLVGTNVGGIPYLIDDGKTGLLVEPKDPPGLADALVNVLTNDTTRREMGVAARKKAVDLFSWARIAGTVQGIYTRTLENIEIRDKKW